jgi:hypothetical protein
VARRRRRYYLPVAIISRTRGYLFVQAPETGCTAIAQKVLIPMLDGEDCPSRPIRDRRGRVVVQRKHCTLAQLIEHDVVSREEAARLFKFSAVRNPFDFLVSIYMKHRGQYAPLVDEPKSWIQHGRGHARSIRVALDSSFDDWVKQRFVRRGLKALARGRIVRGRATAWQDGMDFVMRFERLQDDFDRVLEHLGHERIEIPRFHVTDGRDPDYRSYYSPETVRIVSEAFGTLIERFDYSF